MDGYRLDLSLNATGRCQPTGGLLVCIGHWDYYADGMVWTRHFPRFPTRFKVIPYDHVAPEAIPVRTAP